LTQKFLSVPTRLIHFQLSQTQGGCLAAENAAKKHRQNLGDSQDFAKEIGKNMEKCDSSRKIVATESFLSFQSKEMWF